MGQICRQFLHAFSVNSGVILKKFFFCRSILCYVSERCVKDFNGSKRIEDSLKRFYTPVFRRDVLWYGDVRPSVRPGLRPSVHPSVRHSFSALFSYMFWHIDLKFCVSLYFYARKIKFECRQFPPLFAGVMLLFKRKRKRSDSVLWQKPLHQQKCQKGKVTTQTRHKKSIKQRLRTDLGRSVGVTTATQLVWLTGLRAHLPTNRNSRLIKRTHI